MELNITHFFKNAAPKDYSASVAEIGNAAGKATWQAACDDSTEYNILDTEEKRTAFCVFAASTGAWDEHDLIEWSHYELNALCIQWIAGDMRESGLDVSPIDWAEYQAGCEEGFYPGRIFKGDDNEIYFGIGD